MTRPDAAPVSGGRPPRGASEDEGRHSLTWRRDFLARLLPDLEQGRLRTRDGERDSTEETVHSLRFRLADIEARLRRLADQAGP